MTEGVSSKGIAMEWPVECVNTSSWVRIHLVMAVRQLMQCWKELM